MKCLESTRALVRHPESLLFEASLLTGLGARIYRWVEHANEAQASLVRPCWSLILPSCHETHGPVDTKIAQLEIADWNQTGCFPSRLHIYPSQVEKSTESKRNRTSGPEANATWVKVRSRRELRPSAAFWAADGDEVYR